MRAAAVGGVLLLSAFVAGQAIAETKITYGSYLPATHLNNVQGVGPLAKYLEEKTGGDLKLTVIPGGAVAGAKAVVSQLTDRLVDAGMVVDTYAPKDVPTSNMLAELGMLATDSLAATGAVNEVQLLDCARCRKDAAAAGMTPMAYYSTAPYMFMCHTPQRTLADLKGKRLRATSAFALFAKSFGAIPVNIPSSEIYEAMQRGQTECTVGADSWLKSYNLWDVAQYVIDQPIGAYNTGLVFSFSTESWKSLKPEYRKLIASRMAHLVRSVAVGYVEEAKMVRAEAPSKGIEYIKPDPAYVEAFRKHQKGEVERVIALNEKRGIEDARPIVENYLAKMDKWQKIVDDAGGDPDKFEAALQREIFDKVTF